MRMDTNVTAGAPVEQCKVCKGEGYYEVGSTLREENEWVECERCGASGVVCAADEVEDYSGVVTVF